MDPPIGFVPLRDAADVVGRKIYGSSWRPISTADDYDVHVRAYNVFRAFRPISDYDAHVRARDTVRAAPNLDADRNHVITLVAEQCEAGEIATAYRSLAGATDLDRDVWRLPCWQNYFDAGTINLDLPLLDANGQPNPNGFTARCTCEIFVRRQDLDCFVASLSKQTIKPSSTTRATAKQIVGIVTAYRESLSADTAPTIQDLEHFAKEAGRTGHRPELRAEYHRQFPNQVPGRPRK